MISPVFWCRQYGRPCDLDWYSTHGVPTPRAAAGAITLGASGLNASERALPAARGANDSVSTADSALRARKVASPAGAPSSPAARNDCAARSGLLEPAAAAGAPSSPAARDDGAARSGLHELTSAGAAAAAFRCVSMGEDSECERARRR
jgi:hypothetical protein